MLLKGLQRVRPVALVHGRRSIRALSARMPYSPIAQDDASCTAAIVSCKNSDSEEFTKLEVQVEDFQGLLHIIAWVLKGLEVRVRSAELSITPNGLASDVFMLTDLRGKALTESRAHEVGERIRDFVMSCTSERRKHAVQWRSGPVLISNESGPHTTITILEIEQRIGFLLEVVSVLSGIGVMVVSANVRTCVECENEPALQQMMSRERASVLKEARVMEFAAADGDGKPLSEGAIHAVLFTLGLVINRSQQQSTVAPTLRSFACKFRDE